MANVPVLLQFVVSVQAGLQFCHHLLVSPGGQFHVRQELDGVSFLCSDVFGHAGAHGSVAEESQADGQEFLVGLVG